MAFDPAYLGRSLDGRLHDVQENVVREVKALQNKHAAMGRLQSGATLIAFEDISVDVLKAAVGDASKFAFELTDGEEPAREYLESFAKRVQQIVMAEITEKASRLGLGQVTPNHLEKVRGKLERIKVGMLDDFSHGMHGSERLKKDPVVSAVIHQTNSPGAVAQVGAGIFSQTAFTQQQTQLVQVIDQVMASNEFEALFPDAKNGFIDIADVVKAEAAKQNPDVGKLQRWGARLVDFSKEVGLSVGGGLIAEVLLKIFGAQVVDLTDLLEEVGGFEIPKKMERFLHREMPPSASEQTLGYFAYSYSLAFEQLAASMRGHWVHNGLMQAPLFLLGRHSMELHLKWAIEEFSEYTGENSPEARHELLPLWRELQKQQFDYAELPGREDVWGVHVGKIIAHIHNIDPKGDAFRYPRSFGGKPFEYTRVGFEGLVKAHDHVTGYCGASLDMLSEYRNAY